MYSTSVVPNGKLALPVRFEKSQPNTFGHLIVFFRYLLLIIENVTIMHPELTEYFKGIKDTIPNVDNLGSQNKDS